MLYYVNIIMKCYHHKFLTIAFEKKNYFLRFVCMYLRAVCMQCLWRPAEGAEYPQTGATENSAENPIQVL